MPTLTVSVIERSLSKPFVISTGARVIQPALCVRLEQDGHVGFGEASGVSYLGETPEVMQSQVEAVRAELEAGTDTQQLQLLMPPGGARFAVDSALLDLEAKQSGVSVFERLGLEVSDEPLVTAYTIVLDTPAAMQQAAEAAAHLPLLKVKLGGKDGKDAARAKAVRLGAPKARLIADANAGWTFNNMTADATALADAGYELLEQPLPADADAALEDFKSPLPLCGDESIQDIADLNRIGRRYDIINIKLDKCGGLSHALIMRDRLKSMGKRLFVGCMICGVRAIAPAYALAREAEFADLDGPVWLADEAHSLSLDDTGRLSIPSVEVWGGLSGWVCIR
jgi:L-alanine-DL-glutamate epimerase-like enolase superfamily enzyme